MESTVFAETITADGTANYIRGASGDGIRLRGIWILASGTARLASDNSYLDIYDIDDGGTPYVRIPVPPGQDTETNTSTPPYPKYGRNVNLDVYSIPGRGVRFPGGLRVGEASDSLVWKSAVFFYEG